MKIFKNDTRDDIRPVCCSWTFTRWIFPLSVSQGGIFQGLLNLRKIFPSHSNLSFSRRKWNNFVSGAKRKPASWEGEDRSIKEILSKNSQSLCKKCFNNGQEEEDKEHIWGGLWEDLTSMAIVLQSGLCMEGLLDQRLQGLGRQKEQRDQGLWGRKACSFLYDHSPLKLHKETCPYLCKSLPVLMDLPISTTFRIGRSRC